MAFGSRTVAQRDVNFNVNLGQFRAELGEATSAYARSTGAMSTEALKLSVAEERVARAIKAHGASSIQARNATVAYRREVQGLTTSTIISRDALLSEEKALGRFTRGAIAGSGAAKGLGRSLAFSSAAFLGSAGLVYALRASVKAAEAQQVAVEQLKVALHNGGLSWAQYGRTIEEALNRQVKATAFTKEDLTSTLASNVRRFGDVNQALRANSLEADVARAKNISLADAFSLVQRASFGQPRSLRILGIELTKTTANMDALKASTAHASAQQIAAAKAADLQANETAALDAVQARYHGNAAKYLTTTAGKQAQLNAEIKLSEEIIGNALLPEIGKLVGSLAQYLDKLNRTGKLQKDARQAAHDLTEAIKGFKEALQIVVGVLSPFNKAVGGMKHSVELLTGAFIAYKLRGVAAFVTGTKTIEANAAAQSAAIGGATAEVGKLSGALANLASIGTILVTVDIAEHFIPAGVRKAGQKVLNQEGVGGLGHIPLVGPVVQAGAAAGRAVGKDVGIDYGDGPKPPVPAKYAGTPAEREAYQAGQQGQAFPFSLTAMGSSVWLQAYLAGRKAGKHPVGKTGGGRSGDRPRAGGGSGGGRGSGPVLGLTNAQQTALLLAQGTPGTGDDQKALEDQLAIYNRLLAQKGLNAAQRNDLLSGRNAVTSQLQSITDANASARKSAADQAAAARRKAAEEAKKAAEAAARAKKKAEEAAAKKRHALITGLEQAPVGLRTAVETAIANNAGESTLLKLYRQERKALEDQVAELKKIGAGREAILRARTNEASIQRRIDALTKKAKAAATGQAQALIREFLSNQAGLYGGASNYFTQDANGNRKPGGPTVVVNQHFPSPPTGDGRREAILARHAALAHFDS